MTLLKHTHTSVIAPWSTLVHYTDQIKLLLFFSCSKPAFTAHSALAKFQRGTCTAGSTLLPLFYPQCLTCTRFYIVSVETQIRKLNLQNPYSEAEMELKGEPWCQLLTVGLTLSAPDTYYLLNSSFFLNPRPEVLLTGTAVSHSSRRAPRALQAPQSHTEPRRLSGG